MYRIEEKQVLAPEVKLFRVKAPEIAASWEPGQFVIIRVWEKGERIPLTVVDCREDGLITIIVQEVGKTTRLLGTKEVGESLADVIGPLGRPTEIPENQKVVVVGGGIGTAVALPAARAMKAKGNYVISIAGFRTKELIILEDEIRSVSDELYVTTDDGSYGRAGFVTTVLQELIDGGREIDQVMAIGPPIMMKVVSDLTRSFNIKTVVSLNSIMVDGTGMCGACRVTVGGKTRFVCVEGPDFDGHQVDFNELMLRLAYYREEEALADKLFREKNA